MLSLNTTLLGENGSIHLHSTPERIPTDKQRKCVILHEIHLQKHYLKYEEEMCWTQVSFFELCGMLWPSQTSFWVLSAQGYSYINYFQKCIKRYSLEVTILHFWQHRTIVIEIFIFWKSLSVLGLFPKSNWCHYVIGTVSLKSPGIGWHLVSKTFSTQFSLSALKPKLPLNLSLKFYEYYGSMHLGSCKLMCLLLQISKCFLQVKRRKSRENGNMV